MALDDFAPLRSHFERLAEDEEDVRLEASLGIISGLDLASIDILRKALDRLLKGLASGRKSARIGFSVTLTELLCRTYGPQRSQDRAPLLSFDEVLDLLQSRTTPRGDISGQEERDHCLGRLFGIEAILKSRVLFEGSVSETAWSRILDLTFDLARKKQWLREECGWIVFENLQTLQDISNGEGLMMTAIERLCVNDLALSPEGVAVWLSSLELFPGLRQPKDPWHHRDPMSVKNSTKLARVLKECSSATQEATESHSSTQQRSTWASKPHFVWDVILRSLYKDKSHAHGESRGHTSFASFWTTAIDESLFSASASKERKHWGFLLCSNVFREAPEGCIAHVFTRNMMRCLINQLCDKERYLHRAALKSMKDLQSRATSSPQIVPHVIRGLESGNGVYNFDQMTKTKTISTLLTRTDEVGMEGVVHAFDDLIQQLKGDDLKIVESSRQAFADQIMFALRNRTIDASQTWIYSLLKMFARFGYFATDLNEAHERTPLSDASRNMVRTRLSSCFAHLISKRTTKDTVWPYKILRYLRRLEKQPEKWSLVIEFDPHVEKVRLATLKNLKALDVKSGQNTRDRALQLLQSLVLFQLYNGESDALDVLAELQTYQESHAQSVEDGSQQFIELVLGFASQRSTLFRKVIEQVLAAFAAAIDLEGLHLFFDVLKAEESTLGQQILFDQEAEEDELDGIETSEAEDEGVRGRPDDKTPQANGIHTKRKASSPPNQTKSDEAEQTSDSDLASGEAMDTDSSEGETSRLNSALADIVGKRWNDNADDETMASSESEEMGDDEMFALDEHMAAVFKEQKKATSKKKERQNAKQNVLDFKNRVLDLIQIYIKHQHSNPLCLHVILALLSVHRITSSKQISTKAGSILREYIQKCKGADLPTVRYIDEVWGLLQEVHNESKRDYARAHASACSQASLLLVKALVGLDRTNIDGVVSQYAETQRQWLNGTCRVQPLLFSDFLSWATSYNKQQELKF
ncbi:MAG: DNA-directed DNA polymerase [Piccolia ochrophora]|nr:MAG: DNA-directed DNA polymerase [Piccolia ochrophora]